MPEPTTKPAARSDKFLAWGAGLLAALAVLLTLNDPGMTVDEPLDVAPGRKYVKTLLARGLGFFGPDTVRYVFADNAEHPPLGRWLLGLASTLGEPAELILLGKDPVGLYVRAGRAAPAFCFALLVGLVAGEAVRRHGKAAGVAAALALAMMPRAFAHAHLGALDTFVALSWTLGLLSAARAIGSGRPVRGMALAGIAWGLAILTKIHGWLLIPPVAAWALWRLPPRKAIPALLAWGTVGVGMFFAGWPWLWYDTWDRLVGYFRTGVERTPILVQYFGTVYRDVEVPWHYPWLFFAATVPVGLHALGLIGLWEGWKRRREEPTPLLLGMTILGWLALFSTGVAVYDGERLFLPAFPLWAILAGLGFASLWRRANGRRTLKVGLSAILLAQSAGLLMVHPFGLSYYNALVGGLPGAERLGLELTYWGDAVDPVLLDRLAREAAPNDSAALAPTLAPGQGVVATIRTLAARPVVLSDEQAAATSEWVVVYRRESYWKPEVRAIVDGQPVLLRSRQGVWLSGLWRRSPPETSGRRLHK
jgi:4-amino-4-deoxy-L-arabinose transferase-like glycosyltransferase